MTMSNLKTIQDFQAVKKETGAVNCSSEVKIPISIVYRRLNTHHDSKLLGISG
jgi:hypothetical protein